MLTELHEHVGLDLLQAREDVLHEAVHRVVTPFATSRSTKYSFGSQTTFLRSPVRAYNNSWRGVSARTSGNPQNSASSFRGTPPRCQGVALTEGVPQGFVPTKKNRQLLSRRCSSENRNWLSPALRTETL